MELFSKEGHHGMSYQKILISNFSLNRAATRLVPEHVAMNFSYALGRDLGLSIIGEQSVDFLLNISQLRVTKTCQEF